MTYKTILLRTIILICFSYVAYAGNYEKQSKQPLLGEKGVIEGIVTGKSIIINDCSYILTEKTNYNRPGNLNCSGRWFKKNDKIYYLLKPGTRIVKKIWLAKGTYKITSTP